VPITLRNTAEPTIMYVGFCRNRRFAALAKATLTVDQPECSTCLETGENSWCATLAMAKYASRCNLTLTIFGRL
jgi:hypothetical protein